MSLSYITSNENKFLVAQTFLQKRSVSIHQQTLELPEIQSEDPKEIAQYKADFAYRQLNKPLFVTDHFWSITALQGFPGAYMKYMNTWLTSEDFLRLMETKTNREVFLHEALCYIDETGSKLFTTKHKGTVLYEKQGSGLPGQEIISITPDNISIAKKIETDYSALEMNDVYDEFAQWLISEKKI